MSTRMVSNSSNSMTMNTEKGKRDMLHYMEKRGYVETKRRRHGKGHIVAITLKGHKHASVSFL